MVKLDATLLLLMRVQIKCLEIKNNYVSLLRFGTKSNNKQSLSSLEMHFYLKVSSLLTKTYPKFKPLKKQN